LGWGFLGRFSPSPNPSQIIIKESKELFMVLR
jgi:hypothetical protein